ncbi:GIY-YIG nuclease family protein [Candidatus Parcubacteria bacterium]|jgi:putative endonuclease|nr:MAG: GIY-YIG nuclease family protein [Candidatus Parcubacteria bacterium]
MYYVYVLRSAKDQNFYVGKTSDLKKRFDEHCSGRVQSTKNRLPLELVYYEASRNSKDIHARELYLKSAWGKRYIKQRIKNDG